MGSGKPGSQITKTWLSMRWEGGVCRPLFFHQLQPTGLQLAAGHPHYSLIHVESMGGLHVGWLSLGHHISFYFNVLFIFSCKFYHIVVVFIYFWELFEDTPNIEKGILAQSHSKQSASKKMSAKMNLADCSLISVCVWPSVPDVNETSLWTDGSCPHI